MIDSDIIIFDDEIFLQNGLFDDDLKLNKRDARLLNYYELNNILDHALIDSDDDFLLESKNYDTPNNTYLSMVKQCEKERGGG